VLLELPDFALQVLEMPQPKYQKFFVVNYPNGVEVEELISQAAKLQEINPIKENVQEKGLDKKILVSIAQTKDVSVVEDMKESIIVPEVLAVAPVMADSQENPVIRWFLVLIGISILAGSSVLFVYTKEKERVFISREAQEIQILD
ncbi:hypothetical protein ACFLY0_02475, partial [Patescibacteria group bacterium]